MKTLITAITFVLIFAHLAFSSQAPDIQNAPFDISTDWSHQIKVTAGGSFYGGNTSSLAGAYSFYHKSTNYYAWEFETSAEGRYSETDHTKKANAHEFSFNPDFFISKNKLTVFYVGSVSTNEKQSIYLKTTHQLGFRLLFREIWWFAFYLSMSPVLFEYEENWDRLIEKNIIRFSVRPKIVIRFSKDRLNSFILSYYYQPNSKSFKDYRMKVEAILKLNIKGIFISETKFVWEYYSMPLDIKPKKHDYYLITSLGIEFSS